MVKVLFLDVDGVINLRQSGMDGRLLSNLKEIVAATQCKIVLSSDWRRTRKTRNELRAILRQFDLDFIGWTPYSSPVPIASHRPEEILDWIFAHNLDVARGRGALSYLGKVEQWIAIDDRPLLSEPGGNPGLAGHFVQTDITIGLTAQHAQMAKDILLETDDGESTCASLDTGPSAGTEDEASLDAVAKPATPTAAPTTATPMAAPTAATLAIGLTSATAGAIGLGAGGGVTGLLCGSTMGAVAGMPFALLTFGLSIPVCATVAGCVGLCAGSAAGAGLGFVGAGAVGYKAAQTRR